MKIYTRTGDQGKTALFAGGRVSKGHLRLHAYGTVDELNSLLGVIAAASDDDELRALILQTQSDLFILGADLATPLDAKTKLIIRVGPELIARLEQEIDAWDAELPALANFILPGGSMAGALLLQARTVCRRAERWLVMLGEAEPANPIALQYVNRLSDWLFTLARRVNHRAGQPENEWHSPREKK